MKKKKILTENAAKNVVEGKKKSALEKARGSLKKAEHANTPLSIKRKLKKPRKKS